MAKDIVYYRTAVRDLQLNIAMVQRDLAYKNYSTAFWYPKLRRNLEKWGVPGGTLDAVRRQGATPGRSVHSA